MKKIVRTKVPPEQINLAAKKVLKRIKEKNARGGNYGFAWVSTHEIFGKLAEEQYEALVEMHGNKEKAFKAELVDIAVAAIWGLASMETLEE